MTNNDQLTRPERVRLEAFAQVTLRHWGSPISLADQFNQARRVEEFLHKANEDYPGS